MKIVIFSDTHLGMPFEEKKFNFLQRIIKDSDKVIINGDFWEGFYISFEQFVNSPWKHLFPLLKAKNAVYIYGNHDLKSFLDKNVNLFSDVQTDRYNIKMKDKILVVEHGDRLHNLPKRTDFVMKQCERVEKMGVDKLGKKFYKIISERYNQKMKRKLKKELKSNEIYVCGHTHYSEVDLKNRFVNSGVIKYGIGHYLTIENDVITAKEEWYD